MARYQATSEKVKLFMLVYRETVQALLRDGENVISTTGLHSASIAAPSHSRAFVAVHADANWTAGSYTIEYKRFADLGPAMSWLNEQGGSVAMSPEGEGVLNAKAEAGDFYVGPVTL